MAHVELELSDRYGEPDPPGGAYPAGSAEAVLERWAAAVAPSADACLLIDGKGIVVATSVGFTDLFGVGPAEAVGRYLGQGVLRLLDFTPATGELPDWEVEKIPPLLVLSSGGLARGLLRVVDAVGTTRTVDVITTPLKHGPDTVASLTFFAPVNR